MALASGAKQKLKQGDLVEVTWRDCCTKSSWLYEEDLPHIDEANLFVRTCGYVLKISKQGVYITQGKLLNPGMGDPSYQGFTFIPFDWTFKVKRIS